MALAGELVGVGGHFLFLGLALVSKDWRFLQRMITAPCILFLFYGWPGLFLESARWLIVKRQIEEAQSVLRILAERNRPHGQMLGEEAQEALQALLPTPFATATSLWEEEGAHQTSTCAPYWPAAQRPWPASSWGSPWTDSAAGASCFSR